MFIFENCAHNNMLIYDAFEDEQINTFYSCAILIYY